MNKSGNSKVRALLLVGPPGSGKGTQGRALGALPSFVHCSCGDVLRSMDVGSELGQKFLEHSRAGNLVPDTMAIKLWKLHIEGISSLGKYIPHTDYLVLDGIPRNLAQARLMDVYIEVFHVFNLRCVSRSMLIERVRKRALKENRSDDADKTVINRRLDIYESESQPLLNHYATAKVHSLDAMQPPHFILKEMLDWIIVDESYYNMRGRNLDARAGSKAVKE